MWKDENAWKKKRRKTKACGNTGAFWGTMVTWIAPSPAPTGWDGVGSLGVDWRWRWATLSLSLPCAPLLPANFNHPSLLAPLPSLSLHTRYAHVFFPVVAMFSNLLLLKLFLTQNDFLRISYENRLLLNKFEIFLTNFLWNILNINKIIF